MAIIKRPSTMAEARDALCQMYADVMGDPRRAVQVHEGSNALGKVVATCKVYLEYCSLADQKPSGDWARFIADSK